MIGNFRILSNFQEIKGAFKRGNLKEGFERLALYSVFILVPIMLINPRNWDFFKKRPKIL